MAEIDRNWSSELLTLGAKTASTLRFDMTDAELEETLTHVHNFEYVLSLMMKIADGGNGLKPNHSKNLMSRIALVVAKKWSDDRKVELFERLSSFDCFSDARLENGLGPRFLFNDLKITCWPPSLILLIVSPRDVEHDLSCRRVKELAKEDQEGLVLFLENYLCLSADERWTLIESYPFFSRETSSNFLSDPQQIEKVLHSVSDYVGIPPSEDYYGNRRPAFINQLIEYGKERLVTSDGAAKMVIRHVGDNRKEQCDALVLLAPWPLAAEKVKKLLGLSVPIPRLRVTHPALAQEVACPDGCHGSQRTKTVTIIRVLNDLESMKKDFKENPTVDLIIVMVSPQSDPRWTSDPKLRMSWVDFISFKGYGRDKVYGFFPGHLRNQDSDTLGPLLGRICRFLATKTIFANPIHPVICVLKKFAKDRTAVNGGFLMHAHAKAPRYSPGDAVARFCWNLPFCNVASKDWLSDPLTETQELHVAYRIDLWEAFISKVGVEEVMRKANYLSLDVPEQVYRI